MAGTACVLCDADGGALIARTGRLRLVRADEPGLPAFYRVVWNTHVAEMSDLAPPDRAHCLEAVLAVEQVLRAQLAPAKINLASLGNQVPHLHWHVVARWPLDAHWPAPVWAPAQRPSDPALLARVLAQRPALEAALADAVHGLDAAGGSAAAP